VTPNLVGSLVDAVLNRVPAALQEPLSPGLAILQSCGNRSFRIVQGFLDSFCCFFVVALGCSAADSGVGTTFDFGFLQNSVHDVLLPVSLVHGTFQRHMHAATL